MMVINNWISFVWALQQCASRFYEGLNNAHLLYYESVNNLHQDFWRSEQFTSPLHERLKNVHHGFMKALKMCISFSWVFQKTASRFMTVIKKVHLLLYERFNNVHHGFMKASKMYISFLWFFPKCAPRFMKVIKIRISFLWALQQCASRFYEGPKNVHLLFTCVSTNLHHDLWGS